MCSSDLFLRDAPILILDEATSALDGESEAAIQAALRKLMAGKTVLIIAHRFSTIRDATRILVFDGGRLAGVGTHAELHAGNALYRSLHEIGVPTTLVETQNRSETDKKFTAVMHQYAESVGKGRPDGDLLSQAAALKEIGRAHV